MKRMNKLIGRVGDKLDSGERVWEMVVWSCMTVKRCKKMGSACFFSGKQQACMGYEEQHRWVFQAVLEKMRYVFVVCNSGSFD